jgi:hypothetical protein
VAEAVRALDAGAALAVPAGGYSPLPAPPGAGAAGGPAAAGEAYYACCCSGLAHLLRHDFEAARRDLERAEQSRGDGASAGHLRGLLHGLHRDLDGAREELASALGREAYPDARARIERALRLANADGEGIAGPGE